jgi:chromosomal replication initiator protein
MNIKKYHKIKLSELRKGNLAILDHLKLDEDRMSFEQLEMIVCNYLGVTRDVVYSNIRKRELVQARQLIHSFARQNFRMSLEEIGSRAGYKDHATVLHSCKTVKNLVETDKSFRRLYNDIEKALT